MSGVDKIETLCMGVYGVARGTVDDMKWEFSSDDHEWTMFVGDTFTARSSVSKWWRNGVMDKMVEVRDMNKIIPATLEEWRNGAPSAKHGLVPPLHAECD